jgi:small GTP-binding protein
MAEKKNEELLTRQLKICLLGDSAVGKTSLVRRFVFDEFSDEYIVTIGTKVTLKNIVVAEKNIPKTALSLIIWDILGHKKLVDIRERFYRGARGALIVCDVTRRETLENLYNWVESFYATVSEVPIVILANKWDLKGKYAFKKRNLEEVAKKLNAPSLYTSAKTGKNVEKAFYALATLMLKAEIERGKPLNSLYKKLLGNSFIKYT